MKKDLEMGRLGKLDRILRFALAFWWLSPALAPQFSIEWLNVAVAVVGWISLAESFIGFCLLHRWFNINNKDQ